MKLGKFIVIEGLEGAGKSTAIRHVEAFLQQQQQAYVLSREPGGTPLAEQIRSLAKHGYQDDIPSSDTELLLMYAARTQLVDQIIKPQLAQGTWVIGDRHDLSSQAYQGGGRELGLMKLEAMKQLCLGDFEPDLTLYLDIDPKLGLSRARARGELDRIEQQGLAFFDRARAVYLAQASAKDNIKLIDASQNMEQVASAITQQLQHFYSSL